MIRLYQRGGGSPECSLLKPAISPENWAKIRATAFRLLNARGRSRAAEILETEGFGLFEATNGFGDEFCALARIVGIDQYASYGEREADSDYRSACREMATVFTELDFVVRFVVVGLDKSDGVEAVASPEPAAVRAEVVRRALKDAEVLVATSGALSAVDRVHTALHGYLRAICGEARIPLTADPSITELLKKLGQHPKFINTPGNGEKIERILRGFGTVVDSINQIRNRASLAHANENLLDEADAMLVVNAARTILRYVDDRLR